MNQKELENRVRELEAKLAAQHTEPEPPKRTLIGFLEEQRREAEFQYGLENENSPDMAKRIAAKIQIRTYENS